MPDISALIPASLTPALTLATMDRHLGWALTLTAVTFFMLGRAPQIVRFVLGSTVFVITVVPTSWSLSHWLGLAYQTPSLVTQGLAVLYLLRSISERSAIVPGQMQGRTRWPISLLLAGIILGWILMLDTLAIFPVSIYAYGYSKEAAIFGLVLAAVFWVFSIKSLSMHDGRCTRRLAILLLFAVATFTFTRLPSGNAWDAMLDPWLWLVAHGALVAQFLKAGSKNRKGVAREDKKSAGVKEQRQSFESTTG